MDKYKHIQDGRNHNEPRNLNELMGFRSEPILKNGTPEEFAAKLKKMPLHEMQSYAIDLGVKPLPDKKRLAKALVDKYTKMSKASYGQAYDVKQEPKNKEADNKASNFLKNFK